MSHACDAGGPYRFLGYLTLVVKRSGASKEARKRSAADVENNVRVAHDAHICITDLYSTKVDSIVASRCKVEFVIATGMPIKRNVAPDIDIKALTLEVSNSDFAVSFYFEPIEFRHDNSSSRGKCKTIVKKGWIEVQLELVLSHFKLRKVLEVIREGEFHLPRVTPVQLDSPCTSDFDFAEIPDIQACDDLPIMGLHVSVGRSGRLVSSDYGPCQDHRHNRTEHC